MALSASDSRATFDETTGNLDISPVLSAVLLKDTTVLGLIGMGPTYKAIKHYWNEQSLNANTVTGANAAEVAAGDLTMDVADASKIRVGATLSDSAAGKTEVVEVTAISSNTLTIVRNVDTGGAQTHDATATWIIVSQPTQQGDETMADISPARSQKYNYGQGYKRTVKIADELQQEARNGVHPGVTDEFGLQVQNRTLEMMVELNTSTIRGIRSASDPSDSVYARAGGLRNLITASGGNVKTDAVALDEPYVNALYKLAWDDGGDPRTLVMNYDQLKRFTSMNLGKIRISPDERRAGTFVTRFLTEFGAELSLHLERHFPVDEVGLLDIKGQAQGGGGGIELCAMQGRTLMVEPLAKSGSAARGQVVANWSLRVKNATKAHAWGRGLLVAA